MPNRVGFAPVSSNGGHRRGRGGCCGPSCQLCIKGAKWLPVILIVAIVSWSYYAYIVHLCILTVLSENGPVEGVILAAFYHVFLIPFLMSYWQTGTYYLHTNFNLFLIFDFTKKKKINLQFGPNPDEFRPLIICLRPILIQLRQPQNLEELWSI